MSNVFYLDDRRPKRPSTSPNEDSARIFDQTDFGQVANYLQGLAHEAAQREAADKLKHAEPILLFHVSWGRNAWHSTWIARYQHGTLLASKREARDFIAARLKQGTAFRLSVIPGWHLTFHGEKYLVTEINTKKPFHRLIRPAFAIPGIAKKEALRSLEPSSEIWRGAKPLHDSVIVQQTDRPAHEFRSWQERTSHPSQIFTPGQYVRKFDGGDWWMAPINGDGPIDFNTNPFESMVSIT